METEWIKNEEFSNYCQREQKLEKFLSRKIPFIHQSFFDQKKRKKARKKNYDAHVRLNLYL